MINTSLLYDNDTDSYSIIIYKMTTATETVKLSFVAISCAIARKYILLYDSQLTADPQINNCFPLLFLRDASTTVTQRSLTKDTLRPNSRPTYCRRTYVLPRILLSFFFFSASNLQAG